MFRHSLRFVFIACWTLLTLSVRTLFIISGYGGGGGYDDYRGGGGGGGYVCRSRVLPSFLFSRSLP